MPLEIEKKYLVKHDPWNALAKPQGEYYRQGYITSDVKKTVRVRATENHGYITIKGKTDNPAIKPEYEYQIPKVEAIELLDGFTENNIEKTRYKIDFEGKIWEVDVFYGANNGLTKKLLTKTNILTPVFPNFRLKIGIRSYEL
jgi:CYTH domain-containing protein